MPTQYIKMLKILNGLNVLENLPYCFVCEFTVVRDSLRKYAKHMQSYTKNATLGYLINGGFGISGVWNKWGGWKKSQNSINRGLE